MGNEPSKTSKPDSKSGGSDHEFRFREESVDGFEYRDPLSEYRERISSFRSQITSLGQHHGYLDRVHAMHRELGHVEKNAENCFQRIYSYEVSKPNELRESYRHLSNSLGGLERELSITQTKCAKDKACPVVLDTSQVRSFHQEARKMVSKSDQALLNVQMECRTHQLLKSDPKTERKQVASQIQHQREQEQKNTPAYHALEKNSGAHETVTRSSIDRAHLKFIEQTVQVGKQFAQISSENALYSHFIQKDKREQSSSTKNPLLSFHSPSLYSQKGLFNDFLADKTVSSALELDHINHTQRLNSNVQFEQARNQFEVELQNDQKEMQKQDLHITKAHREYDNATQQKETLSKKIDQQTQSEKSAQENSRQEQQRLQNREEGEKKQYHDTLLSQEQAKNTAAHHQRIIEQTKEQLDAAKQQEQQSASQAAQAYQQMQSKLSYFQNALNQGCCPSWANSYQSRLSQSIDCYGTKSRHFDSDIKHRQQLEEKYEGLLHEGNQKTETKENHYLHNSSCYEKAQEETKQQQKQVHTTTSENLQLQKEINKSHKSYSKLTTQQENQKQTIQKRGETVHHISQTSDKHRNQYQESHHHRKENEKEGRERSKQGVDLLTNFFSTSSERGVEKTVAHSRQQQEKLLYPQKDFSQDFFRRQNELFDEQQVELFRFRNTLPWQKELPSFLETGSSSTSFKNQPCKHPRKSDANTDSSGIQYLTWTTPKGAPSIPPGSIQPLVLTGPNTSATPQQCCWNLIAPAVFSFLSGIAVAKCTTDKNKTIAEIETLQLATFNSPDISDESKSRYIQALEEECKKNHGQGTTFYEQFYKQVIENDLEN